MKTVLVLCAAAFFFGTTEVAAQTEKRFPLCPSQRTCPQLEEGCRFEGQKKDLRGCIVYCGRRVCERKCPRLACPTVTVGCESIESPPDENGCPTCPEIKCRQCPQIKCAAPKRGCIRTDVERDENGCRTGCGKEVCPCPQISCARPPQGCTYGTPKKDENGCNVNCGDLECSCREPKCAPPPEGCTRGEPKTDFITGCKKGCGELTCDKKCPDNCKEWYDGCNTCSCDEDGVAQDCTKRFCTNELRESKCLKQCTEDDDCSSGQLCASSHRCVSPRDCDREKEYFSFFEKKCVAFPGKGEDCKASNHRCQQGLVCSADTGGRRLRSAEEKQYKCVERTDPTKCTYDWSEWGECRPAGDRLIKFRYPTNMKNCQTVKIRPQEEECENTVICPKGCLEYSQGCNVFSCRGEGEKAVMLTRNALCKAPGRCLRNEGDCEGDGDCEDGKEWCRVGKCVAFADEGESCGGRVRIEKLSKCGPSLKCVFDKRVADKPGTCQKPDPKPTDDDDDDDDDDEEEKPRICCRAMTASCLACTKGVSVAEFCEENPQTVGCKTSLPDCKDMPKAARAITSQAPPPKICSCKAPEVVSSCEGTACCKKPEVCDCKDEKDATCFACKNGITVDEACMKKGDELKGCPNCVESWGEWTPEECPANAVQHRRKENVGECVATRASVEIERRFCKPEILEGTCPDGCTRFYDGCNYCDCKDGELGACTKRQCPSGLARPSMCVEFEKEEEVECDVGEWGKWSPCAAGRTKRTRVPTNMNGCEDVKLFESASCKMPEESCKPDEWQSWSKCDPSGRKHRFRKVKGSVSPDDANCNDKESMKCEKPRVCCRAFTAQCMACQEDISVDEFCAKKPSFFGCRARSCDELSILDRFVSASKPVECTCLEGKELSKCAQGTRSEHYCCKLPRCSSIPKTSRMITADKVSRGEEEVCSCRDGEEKAKCGDPGTGQYHCCKQPSCDTLPTDQREITGAPPSCSCGASQRLSTCEYRKDENGNIMPKHWCCQAPRCDDRSVKDQSNCVCPPGLERVKDFFTRRWKCESTVRMCKEEESDCGKDALRGVSPLDVKGRCFAYRSLYSKGSCLSSKCCEGAQKRAFQLDAICKERFGITVSGQCNVDLSKSSDIVSSEVCCKATTLACKACAAGVSEEKYCDNNPQESVCASEPCHKRKADDSCTRDDRCELKRRVFFKTCVVKAANDPVKNEIACFKAAREQFKTSGFTKEGYEKLRRDLAACRSSGTVEEAEKDEQAKTAVEESVSKKQEECAKSSDGNGFLNLLQKAFSSKKQNCDTSVSQIFSKFTSVAGNLLGDSEKTDAGKGLVASKGAISKAADTLKTCLGEASEKGSDADKANSARECREKAREMFEGTAQEENVDRSQFDAKLHRFASEEAAAYLRKCIKIRGDSEKGSCLERATREFVDLAAEETEASSRETILRNIREGALSSAVETVAVCRRKSDNSAAAKAACLTAAKEKLKEHTGVFDDAVTAQEAKLGIVAAARRKAFELRKSCLAKGSSKEVCRKEFKDAMEEVDDDATKDEVETEKHLFLAKRAKASSLFASCRRSGGSDCFAKFKATFEKDDDSEATSAAVEESAKNAAEFIAACMKDASVSDKSSCRLQAIERFKERVPDSDAFETPAIFEKISEAAADSASDQLAECVKLGEDKAACMQKAAVTLRRKSGVEISSSAVANSNEKEFLRSATRRAAARIYDFCRRNKKLTASQCRAKAAAEMEQRGEDVPEEEQEQEDLIESAKVENARKKASEVLKACMLSNSVSSSVCRRKFKETLLSLKKPVAEDEEAPEEEEKDEFDGERDMKREAMRAASEILQACRSDPAVLLKSKCFSKAREEVNLRSGFQKNDEQEVDEDSMRRDLKREAFKNAPKLMKECMAKEGADVKACREEVKAAIHDKLPPNADGDEEGVEDMSSSLEEAAKRSSADALRSCLRGAQKSASGRNTCLQEYRRQVALGQGKPEEDVSKEEAARAATKVAAEKAREVLEGCKSVLRSKKKDGSLSAEESRKCFEAARKEYSAFAISDDAEKAGNVADAMDDVVKTDASDSVAECMKSNSARVCLEKAKTIMRERLDADVREADVKVNLLQTAQTKVAKLMKACRTSDDENEKKGCVARARTEFLKRVPSVEQVEDFEVESTIKEGAANIAGAEMKECMASAKTREEKASCRKSFLDAIKAVTSDVVEDDEAKLLQKESARKTAAMKLASCLKEARKNPSQRSECKRLAVDEFKARVTDSEEVVDEDKAKAEVVEASKRLVGSTFFECFKLSDKSLTSRLKCMKQAKQDLSDKADISDDTESDDGESDDDEDEDDRTSLSNIKEILSRQVSGDLGKFMLKCVQRERTQERYEACRRRSRELFREKTAALNIDEASDSADADADVEEDEVGEETSLDMSLQRGARASAMEAYRACLKVSEDRTACKTKLVNIMKDITGDKQKDEDEVLKDRREFAARESASIFRECLKSQPKPKSAKDAKAARDVCLGKAKKEFSSGAGIENVSEDEVTNAVEEETKKEVSDLMSACVKSAGKEKFKSCLEIAKKRLKSNLGREAVDTVEMQVSLKEAAQTKMAEFVSSCVKKGSSKDCLRRAKAAFEGRTGADSVTEEEVKKRVIDSASSDAAKIVRECIDSKEEERECMKKFADALKKRASSVASSATILSEDEIEELQKRASGAEAAKIRQACLKRGGNMKDCLKKARDMYKKMYTSKKATENDEVEAQRQMEKNIAFKRAEMVKACHKMRFAQKECIQKALEIESSAASVSSSEASDGKARTNAMKDVVASAADEARRTLRICLEKSGSDIEGKKACYVAAREELSSRSGQDNGDVSTARADADLEVATAKHNAERLRNCIKRRGIENVNECRKQVLDNIKSSSLRDVTDVSAKKALLDGAKKSIGELMSACRKVQDSSKKSCKDMLKEEIKARITSSKLAEDEEEDEETGAPAETFVERIKHDIRVSEIGRTISACMKVCRVESSKFSCYKKCTEEAKEAAAAATAADKDEIDEVTVTLDTESAAEDRAAEVCEASRNCDPSSTEVQEAFNEVLPGDVIDTEIPEKVRTSVQQRRRQRKARIALLKRKIAACKNAKKLDLLKCIKEEASDKVLPQEDNEIKDDAETTRSLRDAIERNAFDSLRACVKSGKLQDCLKTFAEALKVKKSGNSKTKDALLRMSARIFAAASGCGSDECKGKAEEAATRLGEKLRALKVVDRFAAETKAVDNMADVADGEDDEDVEATGKATCEKFSSCAWKAAKNRLIATAKARKNKVPKVVREEKKVDVDIVKTGLTEASCKEMLSKFVTQMRSSPKMKGKLAEISQLMKPKFEEENTRCTAAARMNLTISSDEIEKVSEEVAEEASKALKSSAGRRFLSESSVSVGQTTKLAFDGFEGDDEFDEFEENDVSGNDVSENDVSEEVSGNFGWIGVIGGILLVAAVVAGVYYATQKSAPPSNSIRLDTNETEGVSMTVINPGTVSGLPAGWRQAMDESGRTYYYNKSLGETSWTLPEA